MRVQDAFGPARRSRCVNRNQWVFGASRFNHARNPTGHITRRQQLIPRQIAPGLHRRGHAHPADDDHARDRRAIGHRVVGDLLRARRLAPARKRVAGE
jgi:hypothetical protein